MCEWHVPLQLTYDCQSWILCCKDREQCHQRSQWNNRVSWFYHDIHQHTNIRLSHYNVKVE